MAMQIVAMTKVPGFCRKLMNLSLEEVVNIGENLVSAGMGMAKIAAGMAVGVGGLALGGLGAFAGSALSGKAAGAMGGGGGMGDMLKGMLGGNKGGPSDMGGGGAASKMAGSSGGDGVTDGFFKGNPNFMGGPSGNSGSNLDSVALGEAKLKAGGSGSILKGETEEGEDKDKEPARPLTVAEQKVKRGNELSKAASRLKAYMPASVGGTLMDMAFDGMKAGANGGDGLDTVRGGLSSAANTFNAQKGELAEEINEEASAYGQKVNNLNPFKKPDYESRAAAAENIYRQAAVGGKRDASVDDSAALSANLAAIASGTASNSQMNDVLKAQNTLNLSKEQEAEINRVRSTSESFNELASGESAVNAELLKRVASEYASKKGISNSTMDELSARTSAGMIDYKQLSETQVTDRKGASSTLGSALSQITSSDIQSALAPLEAKLGAGQRLSVPEQQMAGRMFDQQQNSLVGNTAALKSFDRVLGGTRNTEFLSKSRDEATGQVQDILANIDKALASSQLSASAGNGMELSLGSKNEKGLIRSTGEVDGFYLGDQAIASPEDFKNLSPENKKLFDDFFKSVDMAMNDKETSNKVSELRLNSDNVRKLYEIARRIKGDGK